MTSKAHVKLGKAIVMQVTNGTRIIEVHDDKALTKLHCGIIYHDP